MSKNNALSKDKSKKRHITNFYMETLVLAVVLIAVILVLMRVFSLSSRLGSKAQILTQAVHLAENAAEAVSASDGLDALGMLLEENGNVQVSKEEGVLRAWYDEEMQPVSGGQLRVEITWVPGQTAAGCLAESTVSVYWLEEAEPVYTLETAVYLDQNAVSE